MQLRSAVVAALVCAVALLWSVSPASAHTMVVVCDEATGDLVWTNVDEGDGDTTVVTSTGVTLDIPEGESVTTSYIGPGTWVATWGDGVTVEGEIPPACVETTTTVAPTTTATTAPPTSAESSTIVPPPTSAASSGRLPSTGIGAGPVVAGLALISAGIAVTVVARRKTAGTG
jgi:hypothetical protein